MSTNGNGTTPTQQLEKIEAAVAAATAARGDDFLARVESAAELLATVGGELGNIGSEINKEAQAFVERWRNDTRQFAAYLLDRKRRELRDLERILGKITG